MEELRMARRATRMARQGDAHGRTRDAVALGRKQASCRRFEAGDDVVRRTVPTPDASPACAKRLAVAFVVAVLHVDSDRLLSWTAPLILERPVALPYALFARSIGQGWCGQPKELRLCRREATGMVRQGRGCARTEKTPLRSA
jgi:hypothetical protein